MIGDEIHTDCFTSLAKTFTMVLTKEVRLKLSMEIARKDFYNRLYEGGITEVIPVVCPALLIPLTTHAIKDV